jgi:DNA-binding MarR family transcriptional regulator
MGDPELPLPEPEAAAGEAILSALRGISRRVHVHSKRLARRSGLTSPQLLCLKALASTHGDMTVAALGRAVQLGSPTVTGIVDRLERGGYAERVRDTVDRRRVFVRLTPRGAEQARLLPRPPDHGLEGRFDELPAAERAAILASLERIASLMDIDNDVDEPHG